MRRTFLPWDCVCRLLGPVTVIPSLQRFAIITGVNAAHLPAVGLYLPITWSLRTALMGSNPRRISQRGWVIAALQTVWCRSVWRCTTFCLCVLCVCMSVCVCKPVASTLLLFNQSYTLLCSSWWILFGGFLCGSNQVITAVRWSL